MKKFITILVSSLLTLGYAQAQNVVIRVHENANKSLTLGERMTPQTTWNRFGIYSWKSFKDDLTDGFMELYQTGDGLYFSCLNSYVYDFNVESEDYRIIVNGKYILTIGMSFDTFRQKVRTEKVVIKELADKLYAVWFPIPSAGGYADEKMVIRVDSAHRICGIRWHVPE